MSGMEFPFSPLAVGLKIHEHFIVLIPGIKRTRSRILYRRRLWHNKEALANHSPELSQAQQSADYFANGAVRCEDCSARNLISAYMFRSYATADISKGGKGGR